MDLRHKFITRRCLTIRRLTRDERAHKFFKETLPCPIVTAVNYRIYIYIYDMYGLAETARYFY